MSAVLAKYGLVEAEFHTAWVLRKYFEQSKISGFEGMTYAQRRVAVGKERTAQLIALQRSQSSKAYRQAKKNYKHTEPYIHLSYAERVQLARDVADKIASWDFARIFAECIDKVYFDPSSKRSISEQALEQVASRFDYYLNHIPKTGGQKNLGLLIHDNNQTVAEKHTKLVREFHRDGTLWRDATNIIDTPLFVDSSLTRMVQVADLCSYAFRRYVENGERDLFERIYVRADRMKAGGNVVGVRHFAERTICKCIICETHGPKKVA